MEPSYLGLSALSWRLMTENWWEKVLAAFLLGTIVLGTSYIIFVIVSRTVSFLKKRQQVPKQALAAKKHIDILKRTTEPLASQADSTGEAKSLGIFLGDILEPHDQAYAYLLSTWDIIVLNPLAEGVSELLAANISSSKHVIGRIDLGITEQLQETPNGKGLLARLDAMREIFVSKFKRSSENGSTFTGVLLANSQDFTQAGLITDLAEYLVGLGLDVWLELSSPYLSPQSCQDVNFALVRGIIYRNATIRRDGDRQNYFQMNDLRTTMRAVARQRVKRPPISVMWETIDDDQRFDYAVVKRCFDWCNYNSALCWIGKEASLFSIGAAVSEVVKDKPLGAMLWLKQDDVTKAHDSWRTNDVVAQRSCGHETLYNSLSGFILSLAEKLQLHCESDTVVIARQHISASQAGHQPECDPLSYASDGKSFTGLGCFHLGLEADQRAFTSILHTQRNLKQLSLLRRIDGPDLQLVKNRIEKLLDAPETSKVVSNILAGARELLALFSASNADNDDCIQVYSGLHSGFQTSVRTQLWGVYDMDASSGHLNLYISNKTPDRASTVLHTFLSSRNYTRYECYLAELLMYEQCNGCELMFGLPPGIARDVEKLSPAELILFVKRLAPVKADDGTLLQRILASCEHQLMDVPTLGQLRALASTEYLSGKISVTDLVTKRLAWLREKGCWLPKEEAAISLFQEVDLQLYHVLMKGQNQIFAQLSLVLQKISEYGQVDAAADIFALSVFCAFRKLALDEVYLEVMDRNPYPNHATDQAGCFAENFALGSRCDSFFDMTPRSIGRLLSDRYRAYYNNYQPPEREEGFTELPTAYAAMQADSDPNDGREDLSMTYRVTFLGIFAVPALIDIMLLTTIGRGLYLTVFMSNTTKTMATTALMLALLTCGAVGAWISSGGSYYLYANAFPAMGMFIITRFTVGIALVLVVGLSCMIGFMIKVHFTAGLLFFFYFAMLTIYLLTLAALSIYQVPGTSFLSGRSVIMLCVPILFISPLLTLWIQHDLAVYMCILTLFLTCLLVGAQRTIAKWNTFYLDIPSVTDAEVVGWYQKIRNDQPLSLVNQKDAEMLAEGPLARNALNDAVTKECNRPIWRRATNDKLVAKLAGGYASTRFLMAWYCQFKRSNMPLPYSPTWNLTLKAGMEMMTNMQKGLKLHSAFLHWRRTGADVASSLLYFVVALMDKWVALFTGGELVGLSAAGSAEFRLAVGFGLCYYLIGAVSLDYVSQPLWIAANQKTIQPITSLEFLREATDNDARARRSLYWKSFAKFFFLHIWGTAITTALMWNFENARAAAILYLAYIGAYSGLLWYQFNKIFCGPSSAYSLMIAAAVGIPVGVALHEAAPQFAYSGVVALASATWVAALHSLWCSGIGWKVFTRHSHFSNLPDGNMNNSQKEPDYFSDVKIDPFCKDSQAILQKQYSTLSDTPDDEKYLLDPSHHPGARVLDCIVRCSNTRHNESIKAAFPAVESYLQSAAALWSDGKILVQLVNSKAGVQQQHSSKALVRKNGDKVHVVVDTNHGSQRNSWNTEIERNYKMIAETLVQVACEHYLGLSHEHSILAAVLVTDCDAENDIAIPEGIKYQLETSTAERHRVLTDYTTTLLRHQLLGIDCETEWDLLPRDIRRFLLSRSCDTPAALSVTELAWLKSRMCSGDVVNPDQYIQRSDLAAKLLFSIAEYAAELESLELGLELPHTLAQISGLSSNDSPSSLKEISQSVVVDMISSSTRRFGTCVKFLCLSLTADPNYQRELDYTTQEQPLYIRRPVSILLNGIWCMCKMIQDQIIPLVVLHGREKVLKLHEDMKHTRSIIRKNKVTLESLHGTSSCFLNKQENGEVQLFQYTGRHEQQPEDSGKLIAINTYTSDLTLRQREERKGDEVLNLYTYEYAQTQGVGSKLRRKASKLPIQRQCIQGKNSGHIAQYDHRGYITRGSRFEGKNTVNFSLWYRSNAKFEDELLRGEYILPHITIRVIWAMPPRRTPERLDTWIPFSKVSEATIIEGSKTYHASWTYEHKSHPEISTTLNGVAIPTPPMIEEDWFHVFTKPKNCAFANEDPLLHFSAAKSSTLSRLFGLNKIYNPAPTSYARTQLWKMWKSSRDLDAITARWLDEKVLRSDSVLAPYWTARNWGFFEHAKNYLDSHADTIMARTDMDADISSWVHIAYKISDYYSFGQGGDTTINTRTKLNQFRDGEDELHILAMDTSTWPQDPGGVSACRRDMVNDLKTIKWHIIAESANDYGVPRFQIERNVQSLTILPLWGLDFLDPTHGLLDNSLDSAVVERSYDTRDQDIRENFLPILTSLVNCSRVRQLTRDHIQEATDALVDLNTYFEHTRNWNDVWNSDIVKQHWRELWLTEMEGTLSISQWWDFEKPTMQQFDQALNMWHRYLFIFSIALPEKIPDVFQASHHFTGATYGILCKVKRNCTLHVWDHCISFREFTTFMSSAVSFDTPFVNSSLISLGHLSCVLLEHHADVVLPCCGYFNPGWEVELGSAEGVIEHRRTFARKIDPVVNGICNMEKFVPIQTIKTSKPTVVMLSHVQFVKDLKNAIMATDLIVNKWGFKDYTLHIYGDMERAAGLSTECQELIAAKGLSERCILKGLGNPSVVLQDAWLFLNSSISEGLPLAMGEAALTGCPVVCTDVGASFCVVTDDETGNRFSEVVSPNDCESLARAQINVLALLDKWSSFAEDAEDVQAPVLGYPHPTTEQVNAINERMYAKQEQRRALGMLGRQNVLKNFSAERYLREHEQMLWIGKYRNPTYRHPVEDQISSSASSVWLAKGISIETSSVAASDLRSPRLPPQSWVRLSSALTSSSTLPSKSSSLLSFGWLGESRARPKMHTRWNTGDTMAMSTYTYDEEAAITTVAQDTSPYVTPQSLEKGQGVPQVHIVDDDALGAISIEEIERTLYQSVPTVKGKEPDTTLSKFKEEWPADDLPWQPQPTALYIDRD